jgi:hypothetical protein
MAVNVDTVYQTVQALANKEQRGYLTPQEFNLFANQAQQDIFQQYTYDLNAFREKRPQEHQIGDSVSHLMRKIRGTNGVSYTINLVTGGTALPSGNIGRIFRGQGATRRELKNISPDTIRNLRLSKWHLKGMTSTFFFDDGDRMIQVWDQNGQVTTGITCERITGVPGLVYWGYMVVNEKAMYNPGASKNFDLINDEQSNIIIKILKLAGISIEDPGLVQAAAMEDQQNLQQENK